MLTIKDLKEMKPDTIFAKGKTTDNSNGINIANSGRLLRWVALRGRIHDWVIYIDLAQKSFEEIRIGKIRLFQEDNIKKLVPCDEEAFKMYRY